MAIYPDISNWHPVTNWANVKSNCPFIISKGTEGTSYIDTTLDSFISGCESNKIPYWLYTYLNKGNELAQAQFLVSTCGSRVGSYFVGYILDVESNNTASNVQSALNYLTGLGVKTMVYTMYSQYNTYKSVIESRPDTCAFWEAIYGKNNGSYNASYPPHSNAELHQYTSEGTCPGISGSCDLNRICGSKTEEWFKTPLSSSGSTSSGTNTSGKTTSNEGNTSYCGKGVGTAVALTAMNIRASNSASSQSYGVINTGTAVEVLKVRSGGWYKIVWPGAACGYAFSSNVPGNYYSYESNSAVTYKVKASDGLNMRRGASTSKKIICTIPNGTQVKSGESVTKNGEVWRYCYFTDSSGKYRVGFCHGDYLKKV